MYASALQRFLFPFCVIVYRFKACFFQLIFSIQLHKRQVYAIKTLL